jgi:hypothetical protein
MIDYRGVTAAKTKTTGGKADNDEEFNKSLEQKYGNKITKSGEGKLAAQTSPRVGATNPTV